MYVTETEVRNTLGITDTDVISNDVINQAINYAEDEIDKLTFSTYYPVNDKGTISSATTTTITDSNKTWVTDSLVGSSIYIYSGTSKGEIKEILSNTNTTITIDGNWTTTPDTTSKYIISYLNRTTETIDGNGTNTIIVSNTPIVQVDSLTIGGTLIPSDEYVVYKDTGKIVLKYSAAKPLFTAPTIGDDLKQVSIVYHYGVVPSNRRGNLDIPQRIKRATLLIASLQALAYQMGGTYDDLSTFSVPNLSGSIGQAYINIKGTVDVLLNELNTMKKELIAKNPYMV